MTEEQKRIHPSAIFKEEGRKLMAAGVISLLLALTSDRINPESIANVLNRAGEIGQEALHQPPHVVFDSKDVENWQDPLTGIAIWTGAGAALLGYFLGRTRSWDGPLPGEKEDVKIPTVTELKTEEKNRK